MLSSEEILNSGCKLVADCELLCDIKRLSCDLVLLMSVPLELIAEVSLLFVDNTTLASKQEDIF